MQTINSSMAGTVWKIEKSVGDAVEFGDVILILESMKMEIPVESDNSGTIVKILVAEGDIVDDGTPIAEIT